MHTHRDGAALRESHALTHATEPTPMHENNQRGQT